ncbi:hypothetical protein C8J47_2691 [Sphingomonas sp. PP-F2F-G114-C0414]|uniref:hypothetical protein n=1 Tax=Sphingomonas sp. PP-F2F-G114-C0414 TaxID=2135662 RepID=UPI000EF932AF|nr:hypothetical protein [Sphingomonas sp. PP-F2F-G114-C0414]RMB28471.1 hypothetical protein C8J47_2691 [Sphingomonas sp. PP-F2F-G114-C0414]
MTAALQEHGIDAPPIDAFTRQHRQRIDGWSPERQRGFLERIAEGATVDEATASVGLSPRAAYSLRRRAAGAAFALGWDAAKLVARPIVAEALFCRAMVGQIERLTKPDGDVIERHRFDNRLAMSLLARLDRHAEESETTSAAARLIATEFDAFLDLVERDAGPARAGLFLGERVRSSDAGEGMAPIVALARADRWLRGGAGLASEIDVTDLDPAARAGWTAEQWARAEAAGLLSLAPEPVAKPASPKPVPASALSALPAVEPDGPDGECPVWWDDVTCAWRTRFPPPSDYDEEDGSNFGDDDYSRDCSEEEVIILDAPRDRETAERFVVEGADRDSWFIGYAVDCGLIGDDEVDAAAATDAARVAALADMFDPERPSEPDPEFEPRDDASPGADPGQSHGAADLAPAFADPAPKSATGRSPAIRLINGDPP